MTMQDRGNLEVGFRDMVGFGVGVALPMLLVATALIVALFVSAGASAGPGITVGMMAGIVFAMGGELLRRYVLATRPSGGRGAVVAFRGLIWVVLLGTPLVATFVAVGVLSGCYGHGCDPLSQSVMVAMLVLCVVSLPMVLLGWRLLSRATWLQRRSE